jgi:hypothetical protein
MKKPADIITYCELCHKNYTNIEDDYTLSTDNRLCKPTIRGCKVNAYSLTKNECDVCEDGYVRGRDSKQDMRFMCFL